MGHTTRVVCRTDPAETQWRTALCGLPEYLVESTLECHVHLVLHKQGALGLRGGSLHTEQRRGMQKTSQLTSQPKHAYEAYVHVYANCH